jgi:hypothetical protein
MGKKQENASFLIGVAELDLEFKFDVKRTCAR